MENRGVIMDFLFFYEHENREYENLLLLKRLLQHRGYCVNISHISAWGYGWHMLFSNPEVIVVPWLRDNDNLYQFTRFLRKKTFKIVNLQMEQIYSRNGESSNITVIQGRAKDAFHLCWGQHSKHQLLRWGIKESNICVVGAVQMDLFNSAFSDFFISRSILAKEFGLDESKHWRLFISSFSYAYISDDEMKMNIDYFGNHTEFIIISQNSRKQLLKWYEDVLLDHTDVLLIYRPHPSEMIDEKLLELERKYKNFRVISAYSIRHWICVSDTIDNWYSTSIGEIYFAEKKCHILRPEPIPEKHEVEIMIGAQFITSYEDFKKTFDKNTNSVDFFPVSVETIKTFYDNCEGVLSSERVCNCLERLLYGIGEPGIISTPINGNKKKCSRMIISSLLGDIVRRLNVRLSRFIPIRRDIFRNLENKNLRQRKRTSDIEKKLNCFIDAYINKKNEYMQAEWNIRCHDTRK